MPRKARSAAASGTYHVIWRGMNKMQIFYQDADYIRFLTLLDSVQDNDFEVLAYCLMGNHLHLLIKTKKQDSELMGNKLRRLGIRYVGYFNHKYQREGSLFQGRYKSCPVESVSYLLRVLRYIHNNPVKAGIVKTPDEYLWSSFQDYFNKRLSFYCKVHTNYILGLHPVDWLLAWHFQPEKNAWAMPDEKQPPMKDADIERIVQTVARLPVSQVHTLPIGKREKLLRRLVLEENIRVVSLSRLTGIPRGEIKRCLL